MRKQILFTFTLAFLVLPVCALAEKKEVCLFVKEDGSTVQVNSLADVPYDQRRSAKCFSGVQEDYLAKPKDIDLGNGERREDMSSPIGRIELRWPRRVESVFGRNPMRAMADAASTVSKALKRGSFPSTLQNLNIDWQVVFMDADLPETQIPAYLVANCHPGWMTPPANIYIVAQRVAGQCAPGQPIRGVADNQLAEVLIHEIGHAVEFFLLQGSGGMDRMRAEGFATWFEQYASDYSSILSAREIQREKRTAATQAIRQSPNYFNFSGSGLDYARASMFFAAIADKRGLSSLMDVYALMRARDLPFFAAVQQKLDWDQRRLNDEVLKFLKIK